MIRSTPTLIVASIALASMVIGSPPRAAAQSCVPAPSGMVAWWTGDGNANDRADGNVGTLQNGAGFTAGFVGQAFSLDGVNDYVSFVNRPVADIIGDRFTIEYWANPGATADRPTWGFLGSGVFNTNNPIASYDSWLTFGNGTGGFQLLTALPNAVAQTWTHYAVVDDGTRYRVYVNGVEKYNDVISVNPASAGSRTFAIGQSGFNSGFEQYFMGAIDEFTIYNRGLTASEIQSIYAADGAGKCKNTCGNGILEPGEQCDDGNTGNGDCCSSTCQFEPVSTVCRPAAGGCDIADTCTGASGACPADAKSTGVCRPAADVCDVAESCDGVGNDCPADGFQPATVECRASAGVCDSAENCTGSGAACPADAKSTAQCRAAAGACDVAESCNGVGNDCPADGFQPATVECRAATSGCDPAEHCTGSGPTCPADAEGCALVFASTRDGNAEIYVMQPDGTGAQRLTTNAATDVEPAWSPDGTKIAFTSNRTGNGDIYVMNSDGGGVTRLTTHTAVDTSPAWSPDGTKIAFATNRHGSSNFEIYVMNANGSGQTRLTVHAAADTLPAWSPDGARIAFTSTRTGGADIYVMNANGTAPTRLTTDPNLDVDPAWSPDGTKIAFATNRHGSSNYEIYVMGANGSAQTRLTTDAAADIQPVWSPNGAQIAFATNRHGSSNYEIYTMTATGGAPTRLTTNPAADSFPDW
jgi:cysteine-rich repeat protein